jgi:hypothetical protein
MSVMEEMRRVSSADWGGGKPMEMDVGGETSTASMGSVGERDMMAVVVSSCDF